MPEAAEPRFAQVEAAYDGIFAVRDDVMKALEMARADKKIGKSLEAKVAVYTENEEIFAKLSAFEKELPTLFIVSAVELVKGAAPEGALKEEGSEIGVVVCEADGCKCDRCWMHAQKGLATEDGFLCERCRNILGL
jgi:isoleucyl-tRNA synthetase